MTFLDNSTTYILGDIHGEYEIMCNLLHKVQLIEFDGDNIPHWCTGCTDTLIQVGDMVDGCNGSVASYNLLKRLQAEAVEQDGTVIRLIGNHELGYISPLTCTGATGHTKMVLEDTIRRDVLDGTLIATYILDDILISHAGFCDDLPIQDCSANIELKYAVRYNDFKSDIFNFGTRAKLDEPSGIFWADWSYDKLDWCKQIVGHTAMGGIQCNGNHINVDCGISRHAQRVYEILKYKAGKFEIIKL